MAGKTSRREFLNTSLVLGAGLAAPGMGRAMPTAPPSPSVLKKSLVIYMLPEKLSYRERFQLARDTGFDYIEAQTATDPKVAE